MNMADFDESNIEFVTGALDETTKGLALSVPSVMGAACQDEAFLCGNLLQVRMVREKGGVPDDPLLRVDYEFWTLPDQFDPANPEQVIYRREHIYVRVSVLSDGDLYCVGLGPEYGFEEWNNDLTQEGCAQETNLPEEGYDELLAEINRNHRSSISEHLSFSDETAKAAIHPKMQAIYADIDREIRESERIWAADQEKRERERSQEFPEWNLQSLQCSRLSDSIQLWLFSPLKQFSWTIKVYLSPNETCTDIEVSKKKHVPGPLHYVLTQKFIVKSPYPIDPEEAEKKLMELVSSGWIKSQFEKLSRP